MEILMMFSTIWSCRRCFELWDSAQAYETSNCLSQSYVSHKHSVVSSNTIAWVDLPNRKQKLGIKKLRVHFHKEARSGD